MAHSHQFVVLALAVAFLLSMILSSTRSNAEAQTASPAMSIKVLGQKAGYYHLRNSHAARMFYVFFESRTKRNDPVVLWLNGGPGCSSLLGLFLENGPVQLANNYSLLPNHYGWDKVSNLLYVDQPTGTGFSYSPDANDTRHDQEGVSDDMYDFLQSFFKDHSQFAKNAFYITGESYAGHYIPALASRIHRGNKANHGIRINLKGIATGNGDINPGEMYKSWSDYAVRMKVINNSVAERINNHVFPQCQRRLNRCESSSGGILCATSSYICNGILHRIVNTSGVNAYDIRKKKEANFSEAVLEKFLNKKLVRDALGVGDLTFRPCNNDVYAALSSDIVINYDIQIPPLLEDGIKVLIYAGEHDLICNWLGNWRWLHAMKWRGQKRFGASPTVPFKVGRIKGGELKSFGPLAFLKVHNASHFVPTDQPKVALRMLEEWMKGKLSV